MPLRAALPILLILAAAMLSACGGGAAFSGAKTAAIEKRDNGKDVELILHPVPVWDGGGAVSQTVALDGGGDIVVRVRSTSILDRAYVRMGLFWHSRREIIFVPVEVLGPPAKLRRVRIVAGDHVAVLQPAQGFHFAPGRPRVKLLGGKKPSTAAFEMTPETLAAIASSARAEAVIETNRGNLAVALDAATGESAAAAAASAKRQFGLFLERRKENLGGGENLR